MKSLTWYECSYFPGFIPRFNDVMLSVVGDIAINSETPMVTMNFEIC